MLTAEYLRFPLVYQGDYEGGAAVLKGLMGLLKEGARLESEESMTALTYLGFMNKMLVSKE